MLDSDPTIDCVPADHFKINDFYNTKQRIQRIDVFKFEQEHFRVAGELAQ